MMVFLFSLILNLYFLTVGWNHNLSDIHGFRQSFTATVVYYFLRDGFRLDYLVPVLGAPWSIPIEFPLYQAIVAIFSKLLNLEIIQSGRFVAVAFFYYTLILVFYLLKEFKLGINERLIIISLILVNPLYIFWTRTVSIESTALFFSIGFILFFIKFLNERQNKFFFLAIIFGSLASLVKGLTFVPALIISAIYLLTKLITSITGIGISQTLKKYIWVFIIFLIPLSIGFTWVTYSDNVKSLNPFGVTVPLASGYFSYFGVRFLQQVWDRLFSLTNTLVLGSIFSNIVIFFALGFSKKYRAHILVLTFAYFLTLFLFANLYFVHDYYFYATAIYLISALGFAVISITQRFSNLLTKYILPVLLIASFLTIYKEKYFPTQVNQNTLLEEVGKAVNKYTNLNDVILIYYFDWTPEIPFYAKRKAIIDYRRLPLNHSTIQTSIKNTGKENIKVMFVMTPYLQDKEFVNERIRYFNFDELPIYQNPIGAVFVKNRY